MVFEWSAKSGDYTIWIQETKFPNTHNVRYSDCSECLLNPFYQEMYLGTLENPWEGNDTDESSFQVLGIQMVTVC